jgi:phosphatidylserine/phosphatidylglycerophosphate/cardiolipin synthase-like enzyme
MYLKMDPNGNIFQRKEISGWYKFPTPHQAALAYVDATMLFDGSILAITAGGGLELLATPSGPAENAPHTLASAPRRTATLLNGIVLVLTAAGTVHWCEFVRGPWRQVPLPNGLVPVDIAVTPDGHLLCLTAAGAIQRAPAPGVPARNAVWAPFALPPLANVQRIEYLLDGSLIGIDNANVPHLLPRNPVGGWQALPNVGPILAVTPLGGHTLLAIDPADNHFMTADALPENWTPVAGPLGVQVRALAHLRSGHVAALCSDSLIYQAQYGPTGPGGALTIGQFAQHIATAPPSPPIAMTAHRDGKILVIGQDHRLYTWETSLGGQWSQVDTQGTQLLSVTFLDDGYTLYGIDLNGTDRKTSRMNAMDRTDPWQLVHTDIAASSVSTLRDGSILEITGNTVGRRASHTATLARASAGWAGPCAQIIELASNPTDTRPRAHKWLLNFTSEVTDGPLGNGRPWGDGTMMAARAANNRNPWDAGNRVTPLIGGHATLSAIRDACEAAIAEANNSPNAPGNRGYVYIADWLLTPLRDLSEDNEWGAGMWNTERRATRDQTAIGLIARMMSAGIKVRVLVWMPTSTQATFAVSGHARQHWYLARMVQEMNDRLKAHGGQWANVDTGVVALDLRTADATAVSLHQKMFVIRVGAVNVGFCGGVDLAYTRRDYGRPANRIIGSGDWQSGNGIPLIPGGWPRQHPAPLCGYPAILGQHKEDAIADELGADVYGGLRHWHDQHLKLEGPIVTSLEEQFDERWRIPGRPFHFRQDTVYGNDDQVQFTSAAAFQGTTIHPLWTNPCDPVGNAVVQLWRTIPYDKRRKDRAPFGRGEFTVMAGISNAVQKATQLITIWDQYFWSVPLAKLLAARLQAVPTLKILIVLPPYGSGDPRNELWYRRRALQTLWGQIPNNERHRVRVFNLWWGHGGGQPGVGVYVHAKVQTYDDCLLVCGSANMNRRSFTLDMELDCAVMHKPTVSYHLANLAHALTGQPWQNFDLGWLEQYWTHVTGNSAASTIADPFYCDPGQIGQQTPNDIAYAPGGNTPEAMYEPTSVSNSVETANAANYPESPGATGRLDQIVWLLEHYVVKTKFPFREG